VPLLIGECHVREVAVATTGGGHIDLNGVLSPSFPVSQQDARD
jgi:hypothetical protein